MSEGAGGAGDEAPVFEGDVGGDTGHDGRGMVSAIQAFPYDYLQMSGVAGSETQNQIKYIAIMKMIAEKRSQRNARFNIATVVTNRINARIPDDGKLDPEDVEEATEC